MAHRSLPTRATGQWLPETMVTWGITIAIPLQYHCSRNHTLTITLQSLPYAWDHHDIHCGGKTCSQSRKWKHVDLTLCSSTFKHMGDGFRKRPYCCWSPLCNVSTSRIPCSIPCSHTIGRAGTAISDFSAVCWAHGRLLAEWLHTQPGAMARTR